MSDRRTFEADGITLEEVREFVWELPQEGGMRVPGRVLASEALLEEISGDKTLQQLQNTAHLPGVVDHAICMPDGHQGYGFPVGGVVGIDAEEGCISPGGVGYDINCLTGESKVALEFGRRVRIDSLAERFEDERAVVVDGRPTTASIQLFTETSARTFYELETETGDTIEATADHPIATPDGMVELGDLEAGDTVLLHPFQGVEDEATQEFVVLDEEDFAGEDPQLLRVLRERDLLPLRSTDDAFNRLLKLLGYFTGDGSFSSDQTWFYGEPEDLEEIRRDIRAIGFTPSRLYERDRDHEIDGSAFSTTEYSVRSTSNAFKQLLVRLGAPEGRKIESEFGVPNFVDRLAGWQKALYLSALFGAEMSAPSAMSAKNLYCPEFTQTRTRARREEGRQFVIDVARLLGKLGIATNEIGELETNSNAEHDTVRFRLGVKNDSANLVRFFTQVGYRYSHSKQRRAIQAAQYLKSKERAIEQREAAEVEVRALADGGRGHREIKAQVDSVNGRFVERCLWGERKGRPRPPADFPDFDEFVEEHPVDHDMTVEARIASITERGEETVYDIGVAHDAHNFVANGFVVSNCGVRMVTTDLTYDEVRGKENDLVEALFEAIPTGLGKGGVVQTDRATIEEILDRGMRWALDEGYAVEDDLEHCEDEGFRPDAEPSKISNKAKDRGKAQIGSLGSGNHFLEVQRVTDVFLDDVAAKFGLTEDQVVVLIHTGSRGLGHQTCTDYLRKIEQAHAGLLNQLPDKELAAAPAGSQLAEDYYGAMCAAINFAWTNRQLITYAVRETFADVFGTDWETLGMELLYDVAH
ncbi:MAG TPA: RtcB family protein, partial [Halobacteriales archaeon]|nr:RtcB family protein [Halobacteriales archaeon]